MAYITAAQAAEKLRVSEKANKEVLYRLPLNWPCPQPIFAKWLPMIERHFLKRTKTLLIVV
jgi:hypothetical protein